MPQRAAARRLPWCRSRGSVGYGRGRRARQEGPARDAQTRAQERQDFCQGLVVGGSAGQGALVRGGLRGRRRAGVRGPHSASSKRAEGRSGGRAGEGPRGETKTYPGSQALPGRLVPGLPPQVHGPAGDALSYLWSALHVQGCHRGRRHRFRELSGADAGVARVAGGSTGGARVAGEPPGDGRTHRGARRRSAAAAVGHVLAGDGRVVEPAAAVVHRVVVHVWVGERVPGVNRMFV
mmetsp:Transcript_4653/g.13998  ORF Transcript_4653/g.13998 Transcript_4653/m.13998 type:complete len:236 (+) Transcript_4653:3196-3903(+)